MSPGWINVKYFVKPSEEEFAHDFLWRVHPHVPKKGEIGVFIRSHYEDILVPSVYGYIDKRTIDKRYDQINAFENYLQENNVEVVKFYLHISKEKQEETLMERVTDPKKHWKHSDGDWETRDKWDELMKTYEKILKKCSTIPWYVIPSDKNWVKEYTSLVIMRDVLKKLNPKYPKLISERFSEK
jgi:polyphosphate kinase 2 (PPK2 family)